VVRLVIAVGTLATTIVAASAAPKEQQTGASRVALATVLDPKNRPLMDVGPDDFVVQEAGAAREVLSVRPADYPIAIMLDTGGEAHNDVPLMRKAVTRFLEKIGTRPVAVGTFGDIPAMVSTFEDDRATVVKRLGEIELTTATGSSLLQGAALAAHAIQRTGALFSTIIVLSSSSLDSSRDRPDEMIAPIVDSGAILHVIANRSSPPPAGPGFRPAQALRALAEQSRGQYTTIYSAVSFQSALDRLAERLTSELLIEYIVPSGSKPNDVKVGVRLAGARVKGLGVAPK
jgi:hypothetical protein